jgi:tRNA A58 N-methylase Trm61
VNVTLLTDYSKTKTKFVKFADTLVVDVMEPNITVPNVLMLLDLVSQIVIVLPVLMKS